MTTKLNQILQQQLDKHPADPIIKDEAMGKWFNGADLQQDIDTFKHAFKAANLGHGDQILVCLANSAVFPVINQAAWQLGIIVHPISPSTPIAKLHTDWDEHRYQAMLLADSLLDGWSDADWTTSQLDLLTSPQLHFLVNNALTNHPVDQTPVAETDLGSS
nr:AMP-binding protein [Secundilactobacillus odoratitofui]